MNREQLVEMARKGIAHYEANTQDLEADVFRIPADTYTDELW